MKTHLRITINLAVRLPDDSEPVTLAGVVALVPAAARSRLIALHDALVAFRPDAEDLSPTERLSIRWHVCHGHAGDSGSCGAEGEIR